MLFQKIRTILVALKLPRRKITFSGTVNLKIFDFGLKAWNLAYIKSDLYRATLAIEHLH